MADTPTTTAPTVPLSESSPQFRTTPESYGAGAVGQGLAGIGQTFEKASDTIAARALEIQGMNNKATADQAWQQFVQQGQHYTEQYKNNNMGQAADANLPTAYKDLEKIRTDVGGSIQSPQARALFDQDTRRMSGMLSENLTTFAADQTKKWRLSVQNGIIDSTSGMISQNLGLLDDRSPNGVMAKLMGALAISNKELGLDPAVGLHESIKAVSKAIQDGILLKQATDVNAAQALLDKYGLRMDPHIRAETAMKLAPAVHANEAITDGDAALHSSIQDTAAPIYSPGSKDIQDKIAAEATRQHVPVDLALRVAYQESRFHPEALSPKGAIGIFQLMPGTAGDLRVDPHDVDQNIRGGITYLGQMLQRFHGDTKLALAAYNAGPGKVEAAGGVPNIKETQDYVAGATGTVPLGSDFRNTNGQLTTVGLDGTYAQTVQNAEALAERRHPGDAVYRENVVARAKSQWETMYHGAQDTERNSQAAIINTLNNPQVQDIATAIRLTPNGTALWNNMTPEQHGNAQRLAISNGRVETLERVKTFENIIAMNSQAKMGHPEQLMALDPMSTSLDLTYAQRVQLAKWQGDVRVGQQRAVNSDTAFDASLKDWVINDFQQKNHLSDKGKEDNANRFRGILHGEIHNWIATHGDQMPTAAQRQNEIYPKAFLTYNNDLLAHKDTPLWHEAVQGLGLVGNHAPTDSQVEQEMLEMRRIAQARMAQDRVPANEYNTRRYVSQAYKNQASSLGVQWAPVEGLQ